MRLLNPRRVIGGGEQAFVAEGREFVASVGNRDYVLVLGTVIVYAGFIIVCNLLADIAQAWMNPKLTLE